MTLEVVDLAYAHIIRRRWGWGGGNDILCVAEVIKWSKFETFE